PMIGTILTATDLSPRAGAAVQRALALKREHACALVIAHIIDRPTSSLDVERRSRTAYKAIDGQLQELPPEEREDIAVKVTTGTPQWELGRLAHMHRSELVVLGRHEPRGGHDLLVGSTAEGLARDGNCSLLVVADNRPAAYRKAVLGIDMSIYARFAVSMVLRLAPQAELVCVHALQGAATEAAGQAAQAALSEFMADTLGKLLPPDQQQATASRMELVVRTGEPHSVLSGIARERQADLLGVGMRGRPASLRAGLGSTAQRLLNEPPCDVLAANAW
ncbi:universal stress protein, partial [Oceanibaculum sp.]|uniref:universal stress protein n=1 Tax=Oceanibaculum sp. TaxID=1903597 RepID=UPI002588860E